MMITHIHATTILVSDQEAALDFYVNTLGWEKTEDNQMGPQMRWLTVAPPGATTRIALAHQTWFDDARKAPNNATGISLVSDDLDATYKTLAERGVKFKNAPEPMPWGGKATWLYDPDGNEFFIVGE